MTRVARYALDSDNLATGLKVVRDELSRRLGFPSDRDRHLGGSIEWIPLQARPDDPSKDGDNFALIVQIEWF